MIAQTTSQSTKSNFLRWVLQANGIFSGLCGILFIFDSGPLTLFLGLKMPLILITTGIVCLLYAAMLFYTAARVAIQRREALAFVALDAAWVIGSIIILVAGWPPLTIGGTWTVAIVADVVAVFALLQFYGMRQISKN